jgi:putative endonuclease
MYVYLVRCADGTFYAGATTNLERRIREHNQGDRGAKYTRGRRPVTLVYHQSFEKSADAWRREIRLKKMTRAHKQRLVDTFGRIHV